MASPAHVELIAEERNEEIVKEKEVVAPRLSKKQVAQGRGAKQVKAGGGI